MNMVGLGEGDALRAELPHSGGSWMRVEFGGGKPVCLLGARQSAGKLPGLAPSSTHLSVHCCGLVVSIEDEKMGQRSILRDCAESVKQSRLGSLLIWWWKRKGEVSGGVHCSQSVHLFSLVAGGGATF